MFPHEARLRNLTYNSPLYCDISCKTYEADGGEGAAEAEEERENPKEFLGWVPIMLRSSFCVLVRRFCEFMPLFAFPVLCVRVCVCVRVLGEYKSTCIGKYTATCRRRKGA